MAAANALPPVLAFDEASQLSLFASELHHLLLLVYDDAPADGTPVAGAAREGGKADAQARAKGVLLQVCDGDLRGRVLCATVGASDRRQAQMLRFLFQAAPAPPGTPAPPATPPLPAVVVFDKERNLRYPYEGGVDGAEETAALIRFVSDVLARKVAPQLQSEAGARPGEDEHDGVGGFGGVGHGRGEEGERAPGAAVLSPGRVTALVGSEYARAVLSDTRDTIVLFHSPWCVDCATAGAVHEALARRYAADPNVCFARLDVSSNDVVAPRIGALPSLYLFRRTARRLEEAVSYEGLHTPGGGEADAIAAFIERERTLPEGHPRCAGEVALAAELERVRGQLERAQQRAEEAERWSDQLERRLEANCRACLVWGPSEEYATD